MPEMGRGALALLGVRNVITEQTRKEGRERFTLAVGVSGVEIEGKLVVGSLQDQEQLNKSNRSSSKQSWRAAGRPSGPVNALTW